MSSTHPEFQMFSKNTCCFSHQMQNALLRERFKVSVNECPRRSSPRPAPCCLGLGSSRFLTAGPALSLLGRRGPNEGGQLGAVLDRKAHGPSFGRPGPMCHCSSLMGTPSPSPSHLPSVRWR